MSKEETNEKAKDKEKKEETKESKEEKKAQVKEEVKEEEETKKEAKKEPEKKEAAAEAEEKPEEKKEWSKEIKEIGDKIVSLTLMKAKELADYLKDEYGIEPASGGTVMMAGPAAGAEGEAEVEKSSFNVILKEFGDKKIQVIKEVRALTGLGLKEAKGLVDAVPKPVKEGLSKEEAESVKQQLEAVGAVVELS